MPRFAPHDRTQVLPFPGASDLQLRIARSFALITDWNAALAGHFPISDVLEILTKQVEACNVALYRVTAGKMRPIATCASAFGQRQGELSSGAMTRYLQQEHSDALTPGSIWRLKELRCDAGFKNTSAAREWDQRLEIHEVVLFVLENVDDQIDMIEMIFDTPPRPSPELPASIITQAMADAWAMRMPGLIERMIRNYGRNRAGRCAKGSGGILGKSNPGGLSRAELRVCQLLVAGTKPKRIAETLGVSIPTVRSHLRNIYAKTETNGQIELISIINDSKENAG